MHERKSQVMKPAREKLKQNETLRSLINQTNPDIGEINNVTYNINQFKENLESRSQQNKLESKQIKQIHTLKEEYPSYH